MKRQPTTRARTRSAPEPELEEERMDEQGDRRAADDQPDQRTEERPAEGSEDASSHLQELVAYLRDGRTELREEWARRIRSWKKQGCDVFVYFDNDQKSAAPADARSLRKLMGQA